MISPSSVLAPLVLAMLVLAGCTQGSTSGVRPAQQREAIPSTAPEISGPALRGTVHDASGKPVSGATVYAETILSKSESFFRGFKAFASLGLGCLDEQGCTAPNGSGIAALDGSFAIKVPKGGNNNKGVRITVVAQRQKTRVATSLTLPVSALSGLDVGTIPIATVGPTTTNSGGRMHVNPPPVPGAHLGAATISMSRIGGTEDQPVASGSSTDVSGGVDPRLIEDGRVLLESRQEGTVGTYPALVSSSLTRIGTAVPASRGASCHLLGAKGQKLPQQPCALTDGVLDTSWKPSDDPACVNGPCPGTLQNDHRDTYVTFATAIPATLLVIRGCGSTCHVFITDSAGRHALPEPTQSGVDTIYLTSLSGKLVTQVQVVTATGGFLTSLREVSLFR